VNRTWRTGIVVAAVLVIAAGVAVVLVPRLFPATDIAIHVAGDVQAPIVTIGGPVIASPALDYTVGIPGAAGASARPVAATSAPKAGATGSHQPTVSGFLVSLAVAEGDRVTTGQVVARLDTRFLELGVTAARAALAQARAQAGVLGDTLGTLDSSRAKLASARAKLDTALTQATAGRAALAAQLAQLEAMIPPGSPAPTPTVPPAPPTPQQLIARLKAALAKLDAGIAQLHTGLAKLSSGAAKLSTARTQVRNGRDLLTVLADGREAAVGVAEARRDAARVVSQVSGLVTYAHPAGTVVMVGAPIVRVVPDGPTRVDTYLTSEQLALVHLGGDAYVGYDSLSGMLLHGRITRIGEMAQYPPTTFPTNIVHMTRAVLVTITLDGSSTAPAGTPVDITLPTS
jgi:X-X-X-Leu-X-X-Gly heptad repeat protein